MDKKEKKYLKTGQINLQFAKVATDEIRIVSEEKGLDVILVQEPYCFRPGREGLWKIPGQGLQTRILPTPKRNRPYAAIFVYNPELDIIEITSLSNEHIVVVEVSTGGKSLILVSAYFPPNEEIEPYIDQISTIIDTFRNRRLIIGVDANAKNHLWYSKVTDDRGRALENLALNKDLCILNEPGQPPTFIGPRGQSNIDLTIVNNGALREVGNWRVNAAVINSDHQLITLDIFAPLNTEVQAPKLCLKRANWEKCCSEYCRNKRVAESQSPWTPGEEALEERVSEMVDSVSRAIESSIPVARKRGFKSPWWNATLEAMKKELKLLKKRFDRSRENDRDINRSRYITKLNTYKIQIHATKRASWEKFTQENFGDNCWGFVYRLFSEKLKTPAIMGTNMTDSGDATVLQVHMQKMLETLLPDDDNNDTAEQLDVRRRSEQESLTDNTEPFSQTEVDVAISQIGRNKAPGDDGIPGIAIQKLAEVMNNDILSLANDCLLLGYFPRKWKIGILKTILKSKDRDISDQKSFRPITLLPELGKVMERMLKNRIESVVETLYHDRQYGFRKGRGAEDAINKVYNLIKNSDAKYVVGIFIDIKGAFDTVWWPAVIQELKVLQVPNNLIRIIKSYFKERTVYYRTNTVTVEKVTTKGCPQGSVLGPLLWNLVMNSLLRTNFPEKCELVAYADDAALLVCGNTRRELEEKCAASMVLLEGWAKANKLILSKEKSEYVVFRGTLARNPVVRMNGAQVKRSPHFRYLGVYLDEKLTFMAHANHITVKVKKVFHSVRRYVKIMFGSQSLHRVYHGVIKPIVMYGSRVWGHRAENSRIHRKLQEAQRACLLTLTNCYSTVSTEALSVIACEPPLKYIVGEKRARDEYKISGETVYYGQKITTEDCTTLAQLKKLLRNISEAKWNENWVASDKGRHTYELFPSVIERKLVKIQHTKVIGQILSGHGECEGYKFKIGVAESGLCVQCAKEDTLKHRVSECLIFETWRIRLQLEMTEASDSWRELILFCLQQGKLKELAVITRPANNELPLT
jgi:hypothetical protein